MKELSIVFAGTPEFGLPCLEALWKSSHKLKAIYTQPDRPAGRGQKLQASAVKIWAESKNLPIYQPLNFKEEATVKELEALKPDLMVVIAYGLILPKSVLTIPRLGCINVHASLLPAWRGASPIQQAILHGDKEAGVTIMQMDVGMDTGDILLQASCPLLENDTVGTLTAKLANLAPDALLKTIDLLAENKAKSIKQDETLVSYAPKIKKEEAEIQWDLSVAEIARKIRAYHPWPIAFTQVNENLVRIHKASIFSQEKPSEKPGTVLKADKQGILVVTSDGVLCIEQLQFPGAKAISAADWANAGSKFIYPGLCLQ